MELLVLAIGIALLLYAFYKWATLNYDYFEKIGIPYVKPTFLFGNMFSLMFSRYPADEYFTNLYNKFPKAKIFGLFNFRNALYFLRDPQVIKQLAIKDFDHFVDHDSFVDEKSDILLGNSLFMLCGSKWRDMRAALSPAFTSSKMKQMFELVTETAYDMAEYFKEESAKGIILNLDMKDFFSKYTNDVIASTAFGIKVNSFKDAQNEFYLTGKKLLDFANPIVMIKMILIRIIPSVLRFFDIQITDKDVTTFFRGMVLNNMKTREKDGIFRPDMINILMQIKKGALKQQTDTKTIVPEVQGFATVEESSVGTRTVNREWSDDDLVAQCFLFFLAGFDTSSTLLSFVAHELAVNVDIQNKLYNEVLETDARCSGQRVSYEQLQNMKYMDQVISEALRKWPPAALTNRVCIKDYDYDDGTHRFTIKKGHICWIPIIALHLNPEYFPNPDKFDPERFSDENKGSILSGTYMPFGIGPRNCIGSRFALMEVKAVIYYLLLNFKFQPNEKTQIPLKLKKSPATMVVEKGFHLELKSR